MCAGRGPAACYHPRCRPPGEGVRAGVASRRLPSAMRATGAKFVKTMMTSNGGQWEDKETVVDFKEM